MTPAISVIMPVRNGAEWLAEAVVSVRAQDFSDFEFLIVDDGSDDSTAAMLFGCAADDDRICLLHQAAQGIVAALNNGIAAARAPYVARLDADDLAKPDRLAKQFAFMEAHPEVGLLGTFAERIDAAGNVVGRLAPPTGGARLARVLGRTNPFIHSSVMMRTALVRRLGGYRAAFRAAEDYDLWLRMAEAGGIANLADYLTQYRRHDSNLSRREAIRQSFSVRLAQRSAAGRRSSTSDPAGVLTAPPHWWAKEAETSFFAEDVGLYRLLDSDRLQGAQYIRAVSGRLGSLNHVERRLAQVRLKALLREIGSPIGPRHLWIAMLIAVLHPARAIGLVWHSIVAGYVAATPNFETPDKDNRGGRD
ncbi:MAG TPA: glycosyltransferase [Xanthobacteraceae bacterium]|nr:glycosyltransferase [Xanthobacteraceae bacterium]